MKARILLGIAVIAVLFTPFIQSARASPDVNAVTYIMTRGSTGNVLTWRILDNLTSSVKNYTIYQNGTAVANDTWTNMTDITFDLDALDLALGEYNYTLIALDYINSTVQFSSRGTIIVTVVAPPDYTATVGWIILVAILVIGITIMVVIRRPRENEHERKHGEHPRSKQNS
jgi:hypothetical protein